MFMFLGSLLLIPVFLMVGYMSPELVTDPSLQIHIPWVGPVSLFLLLPMAMMGISFSVIPAVMWPSVAYIVEEKRIGTAYAIMTLIQNIGLLVFNNLIGFANDYAKAGPDNPGGYTLGMWIFTLLGFLGLLFSFMLWKQETGPNAHGLETITTRKKE
jgi:hypothetical protein